MANEEHLAILKKGVEAWNKWRKEDPEVRPDLSTAFLGRENLSYANLRGANLRRAYLRETLLVGANLFNAYLSGADLSAAQLCAANLFNACLSGAYLFNTNLFNASLSWAYLGGAVFGNTKFANVDLSLVKGLETVQHLGPSTISIDTIYRSNGKIPDAFLKGAGVPDDMIGYIRSIAGAIQFHSCFISYSSRDQEFADRLYADLQAKGVRCWFAPEDMKIGDEHRPRIDESIHMSDKLLLVISEAAIASQWIEQKVEPALAKEREQNRTVLFPIRLDDAVMKIPTGWPAPIQNTRHIGDFTKWKDHDSYQKAFDRLMRDLKAEGEEKTALL